MLTGGLFDYQTAQTPCLILVFAFAYALIPRVSRGWSGWAMVLGNFQWRDVLLLRIIVGKVCFRMCGRASLDIFLSPIMFLFFIPLSGRRFDTN